VIGTLLPLLLGAVQEPTHAPAATQPSPGQFFSKSRLVLDTWDDAAADGHAWTFIETVITGLSPHVSVGIEAAVTERDVNDTSGMEDLRGWMAWRILQRDLGPVDTQRAALLAGLTLPTGAEALTRDEVTPNLGAVFTDIRGRRGINLAAVWEFHEQASLSPLYPGETGADHLRVDAAWLWRLIPAAYGPEYRAAHYFQIEARFDYETNGDRELRLAPGWLLEAPRFALEASLELPVSEELDDRPERSYSLVLGLRYLF
jgi:hypothetical protein